MKPSPNPRMRRYFPILASTAMFLAAVLGAPHARAGEPGQEKPYALIFGTVWDPGGHPVYGVRVKIRSADQKKTHWELYSNHTGEFAQRVPAGQADYVIWADLKDYKLPSGKHLHAGPEVTVHIDNDERSDVGLHLIW